PRPGLPPRDQPGRDRGQGRRRGGRRGGPAGSRAVTELDLTRLVGGVPHVSEGRRPEVVEEIVAAFAGTDPEVLVLDASSDPDHHRSVITLMGPGPALAEGAVAGAEAAAP